MAEPFIADDSAVSAVLAEVQVQWLSTVKDKARARRLLAKHHYLGDVRAVGEPLFYAVINGGGDWLGVLVFCAASRRLRARDRWIDWSEEQRRRRLPLVVNNSWAFTQPQGTGFCQPGLHQAGLNMEPSKIRSERFRLRSRQTPRSPTRNAIHGNGRDGKKRRARPWFHHVVRLVGRRFPK
jgi:Domain of unknown function (DUF4338)